MAPLRRKPTVGVLLTHITHAKKRSSKHGKLSALTPARNLTKLLRYTAAYSSEQLRQFEEATNPNPLVVQCAALNTAGYSWAPAKSHHNAQIKRIKSARERAKRQFTTAGAKTRVWVPKWPNENPAVRHTNIPEDKHDKSREAIVRAVQDQEEATKVVFEVMEEGSRSFQRLPAIEKKGLMEEHVSIALRLQGIEVVTWEMGCFGWKMEVFFEGPESWKSSEWGL